MLLKSLKEVTKLKYKYFCTYSPSGMMYYESHSKPSKPENFDRYMNHGYVYSEKRKKEIKELLLSRKTKIITDLALSDMRTIFGLLENAYKKATSDYETSPILIEALRVTKKKRRKEYFRKKFWRRFS